MQIAHVKLEGSRLPELLIKCHVQGLTIDCIPQARFDQTIAYKFLQSSKGFCIERFEGHHISAFEILIVFDDLAEQEIQPIAGQRGVHEGIGEVDLIWSAISNILVEDILLKLQSLRRGDHTTSSNTF